MESIYNNNKNDYMALKDDDQIFDEDKNISLFDDSFLLHSCLEENISDNIGNDSYQSFYSFVEHCPPECKDILIRSISHVKKLDHFFIELFYLYIDPNKLIYIPKKQMTKSEYKTLIDRKTSKLIISNKQIFIAKTDESYSRHSSHSSHSRYSSHYDSDDYYGGAIMNGYESSSILVDNKIEALFNERLDKIVYGIVNESKKQSIYIPIGFKSEENAHMIGLSICPDKLIIYNGGSGLRYHINDTENEHFPQCVVELKKPNDKYLIYFIKNLIILNNSYKNTSIEMVYFWFFQLCMYEHDSLKISEVELKNHMIEIIKDIFNENTDVLNHINTIKRTPITSSSIEFTQKQTPLLKHDTYYNHIEYHLEFSADLDKQINDYLLTIFSKKIIDDISKSKKNILETYCSSITDIQIKIFDHVSQSITTQIMSKVNNESMKQVITSIVSILSSYIYRSLYKLTNTKTIDKNFYIIARNSQIKKDDNKINEFNHYITLVLEGSIKDDEFGSYITPKFKELKDKITDSFPYSHRNIVEYYQELNEIINIIYQKYDVNKQLEFIGEKFFPINFDFDQSIVMARSSVKNVFNDTISKNLFVTSSLDGNGIITSMIANFKKIHLDNIVGIKSSDGSGYKEFCINMILNDFDYTMNNNLKSFSFLVNMIGERIFNNEIKDMKDMNKLYIKKIEDIFPFLEQIRNDKKLISLNKKEGFLREQYSGSCTYNGTLYAIYYDTKKYNIFDLRNRISESVLREKINQLKTGRIKLKREDHITIEAIEVNNKFNFLNELKSYLPSKQYPMVEINYNSHEKENQSQSTITKYDYDDFVELASKLNTLDDITKELQSIINTTSINNDKSIFYTHFVLNRILTLTSTIKNINEKQIIDLYKKLNQLKFNHPYNLINVVYCYLLLFTMDKLIFYDYKGSQVKDETKRLYYDRKENNLIRNITLPGHLSNENLYELIRMFQKYELFYPLNDKNYYVEMIDSLKRSNIKNFVSTELELDISLTDNIDTINSKLLNIDGILSLNNSISRTFVKGGYGIETLRKIIFSGENKPLLDAHTNKKSNQDNNDNDDEYDRNILDMQTINKTTYSIRTMGNSIIMFYFSLVNQLPYKNFFFDIVQGKKILRVYPNSPIIIINLASFEMLAEHRYSANELIINVETEIKSLKIYALDKIDDKDYLDIFDSTHIESKSIYYVPGKLEIIDRENILDLPDLYRLIKMGDVKSANETLNSKYIYKTKNNNMDYRENESVFYYCLFPHSSNELNKSNELNNLRTPIYSTSDKSPNQNPWMNAENNNKITLEHNLYNTIDYLEFYRKVYREMMLDPLIDALNNEIHEQKKFYNSLKRLGALLGDEKIDQTIFYEKKYDYGSNLFDTLSMKINESYENIIHLNNSKIFSYDKQTNKLMFNGYELILSQDRLNQLEQSMFLKNIKQIAYDITNCLIGIKGNNDVILCNVVMSPYNYNHERKKNVISLDEDITKYPWNHVKKTDSFYPYEGNNDEFVYVRYKADQFESIIPELDMTDHIMMSNFVKFCALLFYNQCYQLLNLYIPYLISIHKTYPNVDNYEMLLKYIIKYKCFNSPYNYYFVNKINFMLEGKYDNDLVYNLSKRQPYYPKIYTKIDPDSDLKEYNLKDEISIFSEWFTLIKPHIDANKINANKIKQIVEKLSKIIEQKRYTYLNVDINDVYKYSCLLDYVLDEKNYRGLFVNLQLKMVDKLRKLINIDDERELIGNIKYFINPTFDHSTTSLVKGNYVDASVKLYEIMSGKIVDETQYQFIKNMVTDDAQSKYNVHELLMGRGKTYIIIPCVLIVYYFNKSYQNIISCMPSHLLTQSLKVLSSFLPFLPACFIYNPDFKRGINSSIENMHNVLKNQMSKIIVTDDANIKTYLLMNVEIKQTEIKGGGTNGSNGYIETNYKQEDINKLTDPILKKLSNNRKYKNSVAHLQDLSIIAIDEFDMLIDPLRSDLNFPIGEYTNIDFQDVVIKIVIYITIELFVKYNKYMTTSDRTDEKLNKLIIRQILRDLSSMKYKELRRLIENVYAKMTAKVNKDEQLEQFKPLTKDEEDQLVGLKGGNVDPSEHLLLYYIREVYRIYYRSLSLLLDKDYGWDNDNQINPYIAIPFSAQDTPMKGSQYSDIIINIILTSITYYQKGLRILDVDNFMTYISFGVKKWGLSGLKKYIDIDPKLIEFALIDNQEGFISYIDYLYKNNYESYITSISTYLEKIVLIQYVKVDPHILNCSFIDIIDPKYIRAKFALSGTVNIHLPEFEYYGGKDTLLEINKDQISREKIQKALRCDNLSGELAEIIVLSIDAKTEDVLKLMEEYQVLIDTGSFLRYDTNLSVAQKLSRSYPDHYIIYFDEYDDPTVMINETNVSYNFDNLKREKKYKVYFDQKHTVGTDIDLPSTAKGMLTIHKLNTHTQIIQGLYRMREINYYQTFDYLIKDDTNSVLKTSSVEELIEYLDINENNRYQSSSGKYLQQYILCLYRSLRSYDPTSYKIDSFETNMVNRNIIRDFDYNFAKEHFISDMRTKLKLHRKDNPKIANDINIYMNQFQSLIGANITNMIQKQSETNKNINYEVNYEKNYSVVRIDYDKINLQSITYNDIYVKLTCIDLIEKTKLKPCKDIEFNSFITSTKNTDDVLKIPMLDLLKMNKISLTPDALLVIYSMFGSERLHQLFMSYNKTTNVTTVMSSRDYIFIKVYFKTFNDIKPVNEFKGEVINDLIMMACFGIPTEKDIKKFNSLKIIKENKNTIKHYYDNYFVYNLSSVSTEFAHFLLS